MANEADRVKYRRLNVGEVIEAGDEYQSEETKVWRRVPGISVGKVIDKDHLPLRRLCLCGAQPSQHRDLPEVVADLRERVARLEAAQATLGSGDEIARLTAERDAAIRERDAALSAAGITHGVFPELYELRAERERLRGRVAELERAYSAECDARAQAHRELSDLAAAVRERESGEERDSSYAAQCREAAAARDRADRMMPAPAANAGGEHEPVAWAELLGRLAEWDHMTTAADGPYWIGEIKKVLSGAAAPLEAAVMPKSVSGSIAESLENNGDTVAADGLRTERVTLEVTHRCVQPLADWLLQAIDQVLVNPGENVFVMDSSHEITKLTADLAASKRECERLRDVVRQLSVDQFRRVPIQRNESSTEAMNCMTTPAQRVTLYQRIRREMEAAAGGAGGDDAVVVPQTVVAGNFAQIHWNTCCRLHRMAMDKAGVRWTQSTEPSRPESEEAGNAGGEQEPPRGWLTAEERAQVQRARDELLSGTAGYDNEFANEKRRRAGVLTALLARETPPSVKMPSRHVIITTVDARERIDRQWIAAIRAAGGEVADE